MGAVKGPRKTATPRDYLSWSQLTAFERGEYKEIYLMGRQLDNKYLRLGKKVADAMEVGESGEAGIEFLVNFFPKYQKREFGLRTTFEGIPLYGKLDGFDMPPTPKIGEYKTGTKWTQSMVDASGQLTFYAILVWKCYGIKVEHIPIELHWAQTEPDGDEMRIAGPIKSFKTKRTMRDVLARYTRMNKAWEGIQEISKEAFSIIK